MAAKRKGKGTPVTIEMFLDENGNMRIEIPHDARNRSGDANAAARFTEKVADAIGDVEERHIGDHTHHVDGTITYHKHLDA